MRDNGCGEDETYHNSLLVQPYTDCFTKNTPPYWRNVDGACAFNSAYPALREAARAKRRADSAGEVRPPFAPIKARAAKDTRGLATANAKRSDVDTDIAEQINPRVSHQPGIVRQFHVTTHYQRVRDRDAELTGEMVVTGSRRAHGRIARTSCRRRPHRLQSRCHLHDAFDHLRDSRRGEPVITMPALLLDLHQAGGGHSCEVPARSLGSDAGDARKFGCRQRAPVHQRVQHCGTRRVAGE